MLAHVKVFLLLIPGILSAGTQFRKFCTTVINSHGMYVKKDFLDIEKCKTLGTDLCFNTKIKEVVVKIGTKGTNDDVTLTFCSDYDTTQVVMPS